MDFARVSSGRFIRPLAVLALLAFHAIQADAADIRNLSWGDTRATVELKEGPPTEKTADVWLYKRINVAGLPCIMLVEFTNEKLSAVTYAFLTYSTPTTEVVEGFAKIEQSLRAKYGRPKDVAASAPDLNGDAIEAFARAIDAGKGDYASKWETDSTAILHGISGPQLAVKHVVYYWSREYSVGQPSTLPRTPDL